MKNRDIVYKGKGLKVGVLSVIAIVVGVITMLAAFMGISKSYNLYDEMMVNHQLEEVESAAASSFWTASNYLTDQARQFVATGNVEYADNYFEEKDEIKRREAALASIDNSQLLELESNLLNNAMELSEGLVEYEVHAMKLVAYAKNLDASSLPAEVADYTLSQLEMELDASKQQELALQLVFGKEYEEAKAKINWDVESAVWLIKDEVGTRYRENESDLFLALNITVAMIFVLFLLLLLIFIFHTLLVVRPARQFMEQLDEKKELPVIGGYEFRRFARKYNDIYRSNQQSSDRSE